MTLPIYSNNVFFTPFEEPIEAYSLPDRFTFPFNYKPHPLSLEAASKLQYYLNDQKEWNSNFGLSDKKSEVVIGKMFGVLVVTTQQNEIGYLSAFSGKLVGKNNHSKFVPPVFDGLEEGGFLNKGMEELSRINLEIKLLKSLNSNETDEKIGILKTLRKNHSIALQQKLFDHYTFLNQAGEEKSLLEIFKNTSAKKPPSGAGECAAPKLLQYAFQKKMKPIAIAEFWWGQSPKSELRKHGHFYPACIEKCEPILAHMLAGIEIDKKP